MEYAEELCQMLRENDLEDVVFLVGGTIPDDDAERLKQAGVTEVFGPGTPTASIVEFIRTRVEAAR
jgi:methylmalonyl-CoA mutase C-terminal domain/subunit